MLWAGAGLALILAGCASPTSDTTTASKTAAPLVSFDTGVSAAFQNGSAGGQYATMEAFTSSLETTTVHDGAGSLKVVSTTAADNYDSGAFDCDVGINLPSAQNIAGKGISVWIYLPSGSPITSAKMIIKNAAYKGAYSGSTSLTAGAWTKVLFTPNGSTYTDAASLSAVTSAATSIAVKLVSASASAFTAYLDSVSVE